MSNSTELIRLAQALRQAKRVAVLTGSGVSAESGIPTFREAQTGLWARYDPQELATPQAFKKNPGLVWEWYEWRRGLVAAASPNAAHLALATLESHVPEFTLVTQNIDGLHQLADSQLVVELHGNIRRTRCSLEGLVIEAWVDQGQIPPRCPRCSGLLRPDVVWFGESLPGKELARALAASRTSDLFFSIGTSALVQPAASLAYEAKLAGALVVEINLAETPLTAFADYSLRGSAATLLPALVDGAFIS